MRHWPGHWLTAPHSVSSGHCALHVQAEDLALEDALYALDKAVNSGVLTADVYLKQVGRWLATA